MASTLLGGRGKDRETQKGHGSFVPWSSPMTSPSMMPGPPAISLALSLVSLGPSASVPKDIDARMRTAGADIGDADLGSDSDSVGTGEHRTSGRDASGRANGDVLPDHIETIPAEVGDDETGDEGRG